MKDVTKLSDQELLELVSTYEETKYKQEETWKEYVAAVEEWRRRKGVQEIMEHHSIEVTPLDSWGGKPIIYIPKEEENGS